MLQAFLKYVGPIQALLGVGGAAVPALAGALGTGMGGNLVNVLSGGIASYLGYKGAPVAQQRGAQFLGIANVLMGVLNAAGVFPGGLGDPPAGIGPTRCDRRASLRGALRPA